MRRFLLLTLVLGAALAFAPNALADTEINDPTGDSGAAPDITKVVVANTARKDLVFAVMFANRPTLAGTQSTVFIVIDTDTDDETEFVFVVNGATGTAVLLRWNGTDYEPMPSESYQASYTNGTLLVAIISGTLGNVPEIAFAVFAYEGEDLETAPSDEAPDGENLASFVFVEPAIERLVFPQNALNARAGGMVGSSRVQVTLTTGETVAPTSVSCTATIAGKKLVKRGTCSFVVPPTARGKKIVLVVTVKWGGETRKFRQTIRVR